MGTGRSVLIDKNKPGSQAPIVALEFKASKEFQKLTSNTKPPQDVRSN
jgi:hypothetical protein